MKKPPKGGKSEKPKESEEKLAEMRRQQQIAAKAELRARMEIEVKNSKINKLKIQNQWRKIMRLTKAESLRKDVEILSQNHERDVDRKDAILQMLDRFACAVMISRVSEVICAVCPLETWRRRRTSSRWL